MREEVLIRMGLDQKPLAAGLTSAQARVQQFVGKTKKDLAQAGESFADSFKKINSAFSKVIGLGIANIARESVEKVWDDLTKRAADLIYRQSDAERHYGTILDQNRKAFRAANEERWAALKREAEVAKDNAKREELRVDMIRMRKRIEEETGLKPGDEKAFHEMRIRHLKEDIVLARERMIMTRATSAAEASMNALKNESQMMAIAKAQQELAKLQPQVKLSEPFSEPFQESSPLRRKMAEQQESLHKSLADRFGDPDARTGRYRDPSKAKQEAVQAAVNDKLDKAITPDGVLRVKHHEE